MSLRSTVEPTPVQIVLMAGDATVDGMSTVRFVLTDPDLHLIDGHVILQDFVASLDGHALEVRLKAGGWDLVEPVATDRLPDIELQASWRGHPVDSLGEAKWESF